MQIFISKYKCNVSEIDNISNDGIITFGNQSLIKENTPFMISSINSFGVDLVTLDKKHAISINAEALKIGFSESEYIFDEALKEGK